MTTAAAITAATLTTIAIIVAIVGLVAYTFSFILLLLPLLFQ